MSTRRVPQTLDERIASLEAFVRDLQAGQAVTPTDVRYLYNTRGDILVGLGTANPQVLGLPSVVPGPGEVIVPRFNPGAPLGVEWAVVSAPGMTVVTA